LFPAREIWCLWVQRREFEADRIDVADMVESLENSPKDGKTHDG
jgi:hypothetical protein